MSASTKQVCCRFILTTHQGRWNKTSSLLSRCSLCTPAAISCYATPTLTRTRHTASTFLGVKGQSSLPHFPNPSTQHVLASHGHHSTLSPHLVPTSTQDHRPTVIKPIDPICLYGFTPSSIQQGHSQPPAIHTPTAKELSEHKAAVKKGYTYLWPPSLASHNTHREENRELRRSNRAS